MLAPDERRLLFDALRPPEGMAVEVAVGTTYTLDLLALILVPAAFALFATEQVTGDDAEPADRLGVLEALRRYADLTTVFCHRGAIALPSRYPLDLLHTEDMVQPVRPRDRSATFHPKVWVLRFGEGARTRHRLVVLSRNLTLDRSWDTVLVLDEDDDESPRRAGAAGLGRQASQLLADLVALAYLPLPEPRAALVADLQRTVRTARFVPPEPFVDVRLHTFGFRRGAGRPFPPSADRAVVVSPFLAAGTLSDLAARTSTDAMTLVSRPDTLAALPAGALDQIRDVRVLAPDADDLDRADDTGDGVRLPTGDGRGGLHAKVYVFDRAGDTSVFVGSANATLSAFRRNAEVLVELTGPTRQVGTAAFLTGSREAPAFGDLTQQWRPDVPVDAAPLTAERLERVMSELTDRPFTVRVAEQADGRFAATLAWPPTAHDGVTVDAWMISLPREAATGLDLAAGEAVLATVSFEGLTPYVALRVRPLPLAGDPGEQPVVRVVRCDTDGFPADRAQQALARMLSDPAAVLRYLLRLLADADPIAAGEMGLGGDGQPDAVGPALPSPSVVPLFESLVKNLATNRPALDRIKRVVDDLAAAGAADRLPPRWDDIWQPIWTARRRWTT